MWKIDYNNDTGNDDESFWEWWDVTDGTVNFKANSSEDAEWLCKLLNNQLFDRELPRVPAAI